MLLMCLIFIHHCSLLWFDFIPRGALLDTQQLSFLNESLFSPLLSLSDEAQKIMRIWSGIKVYAANHILYLFSLGAIFRLCVFVLDGDGVTELLIYPEKNSKL